MSCIVGIIAILVCKFILFFYGGVADYEGSTAKYRCVYRTVASNLFSEWSSLNNVNQKILKQLGELLWVI